MQETGPLAPFGEADKWVIEQMKAAFKDGLTVGGKRYDVQIVLKDSRTDLAVLRVNVRPDTLDDQARAQQLIESTTAAVSADHEVQITVHGHFARPPKPMTPEAEALFKLVQQAGADLGQQFTWKSTGGVCDGNNIAACGVPVIDTMGVRGGSIHSMEEFLIVDSLAERAALSALTILRLAEGA